MTNRLIVKSVIATLISSVALRSYAADQTIVISTPPRVCEAVVSATLTPSTAKLAIEQVVGLGKIDPATYYILHDVTYNDDFSVEQQHWYVYYSDWNHKYSFWSSLDDPRLAKHFEEPRIYGSKKVALVYFHNNVTGTTEENAFSEAMSADTTSIINGASFNKTDVIRSLIDKKLIGGDPTAGGNPANPAATIDLANEANGHKLSGVSGGVIDSTFESLASLSYKIDITKKVPAPVQNLEGIAKIIHAMASPTKINIMVSKLTLCGGKSFEVAPLPSDMTVTALVNSGSKLNETQKELGTNTFDNEKKYWYDFSFAMPLKSFNDLTVNSSDLTLAAKKVEKQNLFAVIDLSPIPYDTKKASFQLVPVFLYGVPISGKPLNHHLLAAAIGLNRVQVFAGVMFNHDRDLASALAPPANTSSSTTTAAGPIRDRWVAKFTYGINLPVSTVTNLLTKK